jgi:hypothetical protein
VVFGLGCKEKRFARNVIYNSFLTLVKSFWNAQAANGVSPFGKVNI